MRHLPLIVALSLGPASALAHGPAPAPLEVLEGGEAPRLVRTSIGLAIARGDGTYAYGCPSRWDSNERALAAANGDQILVHSAGVAYLSHDLGCTFEPVTGDALYVTAAARAPSGFVLIAEDYPDDGDPTRSHVLLLRDGSLEAREVDGSVDGALAAGDVVWLAGAAPSPFVERLTTEGALERTDLLPVDEPVRRLTPRAAGAGTLWLAARTTDATRLWRVDEGRIQPSPAADVVLGPVRVGARWLALFDGILHAQPIEGGDWIALGEASWTCLQALDGRAYACSLEGLFELTEGGAHPEAMHVFSMRQLGPPLACGTAAQVATCEREWAHFAGESGWLDSAPARSPSAPRGPIANGCAASPSAKSTPWCLFAAALLLRWRRRASCCSNRAPSTALPPRRNQRPARSLSTRRASGGGSG